VERRFVLLPFAAGKLTFANQLLGLRKFVKRLVHRGFKSAGAEELFGLFFQVCTDRSQVGDSCSGGEEHMTDIALPANDVPAARDQPGMVDTEHRLELGLIAAAQKGTQERLVQRLLLI